MKKLLFVGLALISFNSFADTVTATTGMVTDTVNAVCTSKSLGKPCPRCCAPWEMPDPCCKKC